MTGKEILQIPNVLEHIERAKKYTLDAVAEHWEDGVLIRIEMDEPGVESPIEAIFLAWWSAALVGSGFVTSHHLDLVAQQSLKVDGDIFRLDFVVVPGDKDQFYEASCLGLEFPKIGVELDGHDFHERTKQQVNHRNRRDRILQRSGWQVFHFSGSELHGKPQECAEEVMWAGWQALMNFNNTLRNLKTKRGDYEPKQR
jgi:hypothetical protein